MRSKLTEKNTTLVGLFVHNTTINRTKKRGKIFIPAGQCLVWDFPGCMGFTDWPLANRISQN